MNNSITFSDQIRPEFGRITVSAFQDGTVVLAVYAGNGSVSTLVHLTDAECDALRELLGNIPAVVTDAA